MKSSTIQIIVVSVFILFAVVGVIIFSKTGGKKNQAVENVQVHLWGILPPDDLMPVIEKINSQTPGTINLEYTYKTPEELEQDLTAALLDKEDIPDGLLLSQDLLLTYQKRLSLVAWTAVSERDLKDNYAQVGEVFMTPSGTYAIPFLIDPLVMYWNRDIFNSQALTNPPQYWEDVAKLVPTLTEQSQTRTIVKSGIALGEYQNIPHAKAILSALSLQIGGGFVVREGETLMSAILRKINNARETPLETVLAYYTQFADPGATTFSWSRGLSSALQMFLQGDSALYIGFGSEAGAIRSKNPNLNFDITYLPQAKTAEGLKTTFAQVYGIGILKDSIYKEAMLRTALLLTRSDIQTQFAAASNRAPVRRELLSNTPGTGISDVVWKSAVWSKSWLDPNPTITNSYFKNMIESVTTGKTKVAEAILVFGEQINELLDNYKK